MNAAAESATVYRSRSGRRYLTKAGAYRGSALYLIRQHCECEPYVDFEDPGYVCRYHEPQHCERLVSRLVRHLKYNDTRSR